jgi:hypothetical protein
LTVDDNVDLDGENDINIDDDIGSDDEDDTDIDDDISDNTSIVSPPGLCAQDAVGNWA